MDRRIFLGLLLGGLLTPMTGSAAAPDRLHRHAQSLAAGSRSRRTSVTLAEATDLLAVAEVAIAAPGMGLQRRGLHRTAALAALVAVGAAERQRHPGVAGLLVRAHEHAEAAGDGPLRAQVLILKRDEDGAPGHAVGAGSQASVKVLSAALYAAGSSLSSASLRAGILYRLAWERAALGDVRGAMQELEGADASIEMASASPDYAEDTDLRAGGAAARRGEALRIAGRRGAAARALAEALGTRSQPSGVHLNFGRLHAAAGDVDAAVASLEDAFLVAHAAGSTRVVNLSRSLAKSLPDCASVRSLQDLFRA